MAVHPGSIEAILRRTGLYDGRLIIAIDAADPRCYPGSGQVIQDLGPYKYKGTLGADVAASTDDPSFTQGGFKKAASVTDTANVSAWDYDGADFIRFGVPLHGRDDTNLGTDNPQLYSWGGFMVLYLPAFTAVEPLISWEAANTSAQSRSHLGTTGNINCRSGRGTTAASSQADSSTITGTAAQWIFAGWSLQCRSSGSTFATEFCIGGSTESDSADTLAAGTQALTGPIMFGATAPETGIPNDWLASGSKIMMAATWARRHVDGEQLKAIRDQIRAWRVTGLP